MKKHVVSVHEGNKPFKCDVCEYTSPQTVDFKKHVASVHEGKKPFKCKICDKSISGKSNLDHTLLFYQIEP